MSAITSHGSSRANLAGSLWMIAAMAAFAVEDAFVKAAAARLPVAEVLVLFGIGGALVFALAARLSGARLFTPAVLSRAMQVRAVFEVTGRLFYVLALALAPLSSTTVILQATPLLVVGGAAIFLGEKVGWRRWSAIALGLAGVVLIVGPGVDGVSAMTILAVIGTIGFAGRDLASRMAPASLGAPVLGFYGFLSVIVAGLLFALWSGEAFVLPSAAAILPVAAAVLCGALAYGCLMTAMRTGEVGAVTPFRYTRLLFGIALGLVFFGESLSPQTLLGAGLIVLSGLFILWRSRA
ncbi:DMT family transporter [Mangrovicoccus ximenensis]|uniref:DMT family transporter n=1 Tax=Mangrovicoccus ximenensis TaxID=1911570 RepID=UPI001F46828C|nr:DMT family transporter [Mangrovicoccus ximenensis]